MSRASRRLALEIAYLLSCAEGKNGHAGYFVTLFLLGAGALVLLAPFIVWVNLK